MWGERGGKLVNLGDFLGDISIITMVYLLFVGLSSFPVTVANEGLVGDSLLKMVHNPGW